MVVSLEMQLKILTEKDRKKKHARKTNDRQINTAKCED